MMEIGIGEMQRIMESNLYNLEVTVTATALPLQCTYQNGVPMNESLLCSGVLFSADTPKSASMERRRRATKQGKY